MPVTFLADAGAKVGGFTAPCRVTYRTGKDAPIATAALPARLAIGPVLRSCYRHPETNVYRIDAPRYTMESDMFHSLCRYLADDDGTVRLQGSPLFLFCSEKEDMLYAGTRQAFTWPTAAPAHLKTVVQERCWYHLAFGADRVTVSVDSGQTQFDPAYFTVPGRWISPKGTPRWARIVAVDAGGREVSAKPGTKLNVAAAELAFPGATWNLAFAFTPPQPVTFHGVGLEFPIGSFNGDAWSVGFCKPGKLDAWRKER